MNHSGHCKLWWLLAQLTAPDAARPDILQTLASELTNCGRKMKQALVAFAFNSVFFQSILRFRVCVAGEANFETPKNQFHLRTDEISNPKQLPSDDSWLKRGQIDRERSAGFIRDSQFFIKRLLVMNVRLFWPSSWLLWFSWFQLGHMGEIGWDADWSLWFEGFLPACNPFTAIRRLPWGG